MKKIVSIVTLGLVLCLTGCGSGSYMRSESYAPAADAYNGYDGSFADSYTTSKEAYVTGGDYSRTNIDGDKVDYSYTFRATGETDKSKDAMLADYEYIQQVTKDNGGFIEDVYNDYSYEEIDEDMHYFSDYEKKYKATGRLSFTVEISNDKVDLITDELEKLCADNHFTVTNYSQRITNYEVYDIVEEDAEHYYDDTITQHELDKRLAFADIVVNLDYRIPRAKSEQARLTIKGFFYEIWDMLGEVIQIVISIIILILVLFIMTVLCYKWFKKMVFKHKKKHPELYPPKEVYVMPEQRESN